VSAHEQPRGQDTAVVIDSSGWLEYFADGPNAGEFAAAIEAADPLVVPALALFEVYKRLHQQRGEEVALQAVNAMQRRRSPPHALRSPTACRWRTA
jgi:uncharacterized protein with PIN domain